MPNPLDHCMIKHSLNQKKLKIASKGLYRLIHWFEYIRLNNESARAKTNEDGKHDINKNKFS